MKSNRMWMRSSRTWMRSRLADCGWDLTECRWDLAKCGMWRRSSRVVRASYCQSKRCNSPWFNDPSILRHSGIWGAVDEAVLNKVLKNPNKPRLKHNQNNSDEDHFSLHSHSLVLPVGEINYHCSTGYPSFFLANILHWKPSSLSPLNITITGRPVSDFWRVKPRGGGLLFGEW